MNPIISAPILAYHQITPKAPPANLGYAVSVRQFERQMRFLREHGYVCLSLAELMRHSDNGQPRPRRSVALTFDDGYGSFSKLAYPILRCYGLTATVFVVTNEIHRQSYLKRGFHSLYLTWEQIGTLQQGGISLGSHTCTHSRLPGLSREEIQRELADSKECLEVRLGQEIRWLAYPYADSTSEIRKMAEEAGYEAAFGGSRGRSSRFNMRRYFCRRDDTLVTFVFRLSRYHHCLEYLREDTEVGRVLRRVKHRMVPNKGYDERPAG
jgi:peptidoglycan/xylan/chitin deacetylase (PgdA/CDA1 family)